MKFILTLGLVFGLAASVFATGNFGVNPVQTGVITVNNGVSIVTNSFAESYTVPPVLLVYSSLTNGTPLTNEFVTTTNFAIGFPAGGTNSSFTWTSFVGGTRLQTGTNAMTGGTPVTNSFTYPYYLNPSVLITGATTNGVGLTSVSPTNFIMLSAVSQNVMWMSVGTVVTPASENTGNFPVVNKVVY